MWCKSAVHACSAAYDHAYDRAGVHVKAWFAPLDEDDKGGDLALR